jgi:hypothetical protein
LDAIRHVLSDRDGRDFRSWSQIAREIFACNQPIAPRRVKSTELMLVIHLNPQIGFAYCVFQQVIP